jgi:hypothetical protein
MVHNDKAIPRLRLPLGQQDAGETTAVNWASPSADHTLFSRCT